MGINIERRGIDSVIQGFQLYGVPNFSVWLTKELKFAYTGNNMEEALSLLQQNLETIAQSGTVAVYTLRAHPGVDRDGFISNNTRYIGSFNFQMRSTDVPTTQGGREEYRREKSYNDRLMEERLERIEQALANLGTGAAAQGEPLEDDIVIRRIDAIGSLPGVQEALPVLINGIMDKFLGTGNGAHNMAGMAGVPAELEDQVATAVQMLIEKVPGSAEALIKLGKMAEVNPKKVAGYVNLLKTFV